MTTTTTINGHTIVAERLQQGWSATVDHTYAGRGDSEQAALDVAARFVDRAQQARRRQLMAIVEHVSAPGPLTATPSLHWVDLDIGAGRVRIALDFVLREPHVRVYSYDASGATTGTFDLSTTNRLAGSIISAILADVAQGPEGGTT